MLRSRGWRNIYLGGDSPAGTVHMAADTVDSHLIILSAVSADRYASVARELRAVARQRRVIIAGAGATPEVEAELGVERLSGDPATAAEEFSRQFIREAAGA